MHVHSGGGKIHSVHGWYIFNICYVSAIGRVSPPTTRLQASQEAFNVPSNDLKDVSEPTALSMYPRFYFNSGLDIVASLDRM